MFISPYQESIFTVESPYYSVYDVDIPNLTAEFELVVNTQLDFLATDNTLTALRAN